jgi:plastocyanin
MRTRRWVSAALAAGVTVALAMVPTTADAAPATVNVQVGGGDGPVRGVVFEGMRFFAPPTFTVHQGDTINFGFAGFHTATILPAGVGAEDWRADHTGPGGDYSLIKPDTDGLTPAFEFNQQALFPTDPNCGTTVTPCPYDGSLVVNSGAPLGSPTFAATINAAPGTSFWVVCLVHSMMQMRVTVVSDTTTTTTQAQLDSYTSRTLANDKREASALVPKLETQTRSKTSTGYVWDAYAGFDGDGWGLDAMFPATLHVKKGDTVRWHFSQLVGNIHTVTFPKSKANNFANNDFSASRVRCDPGDAMPDTGPPVFCTTGTPEFELRATAVLQQGGTSYSGTGLHSSGVRGPDGLSTQSYRLTFKHRSSTGWKYACAIHGAMMSGNVIVS